MGKYPDLSVDWNQPQGRVLAQVEFLTHRCYAELEPLTLEVDAEPIRGGIDQFVAKVAEAVQMRSRISDIACALIRLEAQAAKRANSAETRYKLTLDAARADEGLQGKDAGARDANAKIRASQERLDADFWDGIRYDVKACLAVAKDRLENCDKAHEGLSKQKGMLEIGHKNGGA